MRREHLFRMAEPDALALLRRAPFHRLAAVSADGRPILRAVHAVLLDGALWFHGAPAGEKLDAIGREVVLQAEEVVAEIPSYFTDPERACPATTLYQSVQVQGRLEAVADEDLDAKARALQAIMERYQPEGGHVPITADDPRYRSAVRGILIARVPIAQLDGKAKLGQNRRPEEVTRLLASMWRRGAPGDARAVELVARANPEAALPPVLASPGPGLRLCAAPDRDGPLADEAAALLAGTYWNEGRFSREEIARAHRAPGAAWVVCVDEAGALVGTARAITDGAKHAWVYDVCVVERLRGRRIGHALMALLLDHPLVRGARFVHLGTRDRMRFYSDFGFVARDDLQARGSTAMILDRPRV
jgi:nitroimidazol reductase NimA-like FMN-containing flavoprotein (pyridoxamine 5'-phosphate oxidase superfamily)/GNAT superfamily N-acetyltransferase